MTTYVQRIDRSTDLFTQGKLYELHPTGGKNNKPHIINDVGNRSVPYLEGYKYWVYFTTAPVPTPPAVPCAQPAVVPLVIATDYAAAGGDYTLNPTIKNAFGGTMLKVEHVKYTTINGTKLDALSEEQIIDAITTEKERGATLELLDLESEAVGAIIERHRCNVDILLGELEARLAADNDD